MTLEELRIVISASTEPLRKEMENVKKQLSRVEKETAKTTSGIQNLFKKLLVGVIVLKIGQKIGEAIIGGIKEAMNVEAALQQIKRIMGESSNQFLKWADTQAIAFNMSKGQALRYGNIFGNLVSGFSNSTAEITKNTEDVLKASSIIASATGRTMEDVMERIRSGLLGNTESIEDLGVNVNVAMIQSTEAFKKFANGKSWEQLSFQTQQQIRLMAILEQTSKKYGDTVNQNTSTQLAQLVAQLNNVKLSLGNAFLPIVQTVLPILTALAQQLSYVMNIVAQFSQALFGKGMQTGNKQPQNTQSQAKAMTNLGNATEKAGKQAKGALAGFDEINSLSFGDSASTDGGSLDTTGTALAPSMDMGGITDSVGGIAPEIQAMVDKVKESISNIFEPFKNSWQEHGKQVMDGLNLAWENTKKILSDIGNLLGSIWDNGGAQLAENISDLTLSIGILGLKIYNDFIVPVIEWFLNELDPLTNEAMANMLEGLNSIVEGATKVVEYFTGGGFEYVIAAIAGIAGAFALIQIAGLIADIPILIGAIGGLLSPIVLVTAGIVGLIGYFAYLYRTNEDFRNSINNVWNDISNTLNDFIDNTIKPIFDYLVNSFLIPLGKAIIDNILPIVKDLYIGIGQILSDLLNLLTSTISNLWGILNPALELIKKVIIDALEIVKGLWNKYGQDILANVSTFIKGVQDTFQLIWDNIINPIIKPALEMLSWLWEEHLSKLVQQVGEFIMKLVKGALELYNGFIKPIVDGLIKDFGPAFSTVISFVVDLFGSGIAGIIDIAQGLIRFLGGVIDFIVGVFTGDWEQAWQGIKDIFGGIFDSLVGLVKVPLNYIIDAINAVIRGLNKISFDIPDIPGIPGGGTKFGINIREIPKLARGGIVNSPTIAQIGEAGTEAVVPLENTSFVTTLANALAMAVMGAMSQYSSSNGSSNTNSGDLILMINEMELGRISISSINKVQKKAGVTLMKV